MVLDRMRHSEMRSKYLGAILALISILLTSSGTFGENSIVMQREAEILSLATNPTENAEALHDALEKTSGLSVDDAIRLYTSLTDYYLGEHSGEILSEQITKLGDKVVPFLVKKKNSPLSCLDKYKELCLSINERNRFINIVLETISKGYAEFPEDFGPKFQKQLNIIEIFIEDYKRKFEKLPKDLAALREYAWKAYGYKLKIYNPWGVPVVYKPGENGQKYSIDPGSDIDINDLPGFLASGENVNETNYGETALMIAAYNGKAELVKALLARGADVNAKDNTAMTALMDAARFGYCEIVQILLANGADVNAKDNNGETALTLVTSQGYKKIVRLLKEAGAKE